MGCDIQLVAGGLGDGTVLREGTSRDIDGGLGFEVVASAVFSIVDRRASLGNRSLGLPLHDPRLAA